MQRALSFEQTPPLSVPLRFFMTAPAFALAAALVLLWHGEAALQTRWAPLTLALTHLLTLGFLAMCMIGALLQILPVVLGIQIPHSRHVAAAGHILLTAGTSVLCAAFVSARAALFQLALPLLVTAFGWLFLAGLRGAWSSAGQPSPMLGAIRLALAALLVTIALGALAASAFAWRVPLPLVLLTDAHAGWGLAGWITLLIAGVAYQVVPMFQITPNYPAAVTRCFAPVLFGALAIWSLTLLPGVHPVLAGMPGFAVAALLLGFAAITLNLLRQRKRPQADPTTRFWRTGLVSLLACALAWIAAPQIEQFSGAHTPPLLIGSLFLCGFAYSVVNGMLYKIVPFLVWYHLQQNLAGGAVRAPNVRQILPDAPALLQWRVHVLALVLLVAAVFWPYWLARPAALVFAVSTLLLWRNLWRAARLYREIDAILPERVKRERAYLPS